MKDTLRLKRFNLISGLARRLVGEPLVSQAAQTLELLLAGLPCPAGVVLTAGELRGALQWSGEQGFRPDLNARRTIIQLAERVLSIRRSVVVHDLATPLAKVEGAQYLVELGFYSLIAVPVVQQRRGLAVLIALFDRASASTEECVDFCQGISNVFGLVLGRPPNPPPAPSSLSDEVSSQNEPKLGSDSLRSALSHELRGPVGALALHLEEQEHLLHDLAELCGPSDTALGASLSELSELTSDIRAVTDQLRDLVGSLSAAHPHASPAGELDLGELVRDALAQLRPHLERMGIGCEEHLAEGYKTIGKRSELRQVILALIQRAAESCGDSGGRVTVTVDGDLERAYLKVVDLPYQVGASARPISGAHAEGSKEPRLAYGSAAGTRTEGWRKIVANHRALREHQHTIREHGGELKFSRASLPSQSELSSGPVNSSAPQPPSSLNYNTEIRLSLPLLSRPSYSRGAELGEAPLTPPKQIFVIDDDEVFARTMRRALKPQAVRSASSASEAEIALLDPNFSPDLVLCDIFLPGTNGDELHARVRKHRPEVARSFVFITGGALTSTQANYLERSGQPTLQKPLDMSQIRHLLESRSQLGL